MTLEGLVLVRRSESGDDLHFFSTGGEQARIFQPNFGEKPCAVLAAYLHELAIVSFDQNDLLRGVWPEHFLTV